MRWWLFLIASLTAGRLMAQSHAHRPDLHQERRDGRREATGQAAFATIAEVAELLTSDSATDWSRVDLDALRRHLIDMDDVMMRAESEAVSVPGGLRIIVRGTGKVGAAVRRMIVAHATALDAMPRYRASAEPSDDGAILVVTAETPSDATTAARIRGLGFAGLLTEGAHHSTHHLMIARGEAAPGHGTPR